MNRCPRKNHRKIRFLISFGEYEKEFYKNLVLLGKNGYFEILKDLGKIIGKILKNYDFSQYYLVPIPLTRKKLWQRGYNQTEVLCEAISQETGLKIAKILKKIKETKDQAELSYEERLVNLEGVFKFEGDFVPQKVILVDDVKTTGATLKESAKILKKAGVKEIIALTILR